MKVLKKSKLCLKYVCIYVCILQEYNCIHFIVSRLHNICSKSYKPANDLNMALSNTSYENN